MGGSGSGTNQREILNTSGINNISTGDTTMTWTEALSALRQLETNDVQSAAATCLIDPADYAIIRLQQLTMAVECLLSRVIKS